MRSLASVVLLLILSATLCAQLPTATVNGTVTDPQGAAVVGARIIVTNKATGVSRETTSGADGRYALPGLAPGDYVERVSAAGFATSEATDLHLDVGRAVTLDVPLKVAKVGEVVTVTGGELAIDTTQSEVQGTVESGTIESIPLNGRNFLELALLMPGNAPAPSVANPTSQRPDPDTRRACLRFTRRSSAQGMETARVGGIVWARMTEV